jgi:radical SAM/Cys-rich protein
MVALSLLKDRHPLASAHSQRNLLAQLPLAQTFEAAISSSPLGRLTATGVEVLQLNLGKVCNQACHHCHVDAAPDRTEVMPDDVVDACLRVLEETDIPVLDLTGGAPEMHPRFEEMVSRAAALKRQVLDRCNLTILTTPSHRHLPDFLARHGVEVVSSLPYHTADSTDAQRGEGVFEKSITALKALNAVGYGLPGSPLVLTLVTNPTGAFLPAPQVALEADFRRILRMRHGVEFTRLINITNMPISRYLEWLQRSGNLQRYLDKLVGAFNSAAANGVMCRTLLSVGWDGRLFDCDFNQMLEMELVDGQPRTIHQFDRALLAGRDIAVGPHCFGCTAGQGSSCGGATV